LLCLFRAESGPPFGDGGSGRLPAGPRPLSLFDAIFAIE
jgi:hypothetical protein